MSEKRFELEISSFSGKHMKFLNILDNGKRLNSEEIVDLLNEQQATIHKLQDFIGKTDAENIRLRQEIRELKAKLREKEEDEQLYANEILELRETNKEHIKFKSLGGNY